MITLRTPVTHTVWGPLNTQADLVHAIAKSGLPFGADESGFGFPGLGLHQGIDIPVVTGTEVHSMTNGVVSRVSDVVKDGIGVIIYDASQSIQCLYWHLLSHSVKVGDTITTGQIIGLSDNTGWSLGPHLHAQCNLTDAQGHELNAVDPMPYFVWDTMTAQQVSEFYHLVFFRDPTPAEAAYWLGKEMSALLHQARVDRAAFLALPV